MIVDANVLLYAVDERAPFHDSARIWLESAMGGPGRVGLPWVTLTAFQRIITHPRVTAAPLAAEQAWSHIEDWLDVDGVWIPVPGPRHRNILGELVVGGDLRGNLVPDAHLAALAIEYGVGICSFDTDFARFDGLRWERPGPA